MLAIYELLIQVMQLEGKGRLTKLAGQGSRIQDEDDNGTDDGGDDDDDADDHADDDDVDDEGGG